MFGNVSSPVTDAEKECFPYACTPAKRIPRCLRYRAEGQTPLDCAVHVISYLRKQKQKLWIAAKEEVAYFREQRRLLGQLAREEVNGADVRLAMVGDIMWIADGWSTFLSNDVLEYLNTHDIVLGNLETVISPSFRVSRPLRDFAWFNSDPALLTSFRRPDGRNTFTALSIANNHVLDYHDRGCRDLAHFLDRQGISHSGVREHADERAYTTVTVNGIKVGFFAATWGLNDRRRLQASKLRINTIEGMAPEGQLHVDLSDVKLAMEAMEAEGIDVKVVCLHWGFEFELFPTPRTMQIARGIVKAGADIIMGSHPHVQQPAEVLFVNGYEKHHSGQIAGVAGLRHPPGCVLDAGSGGARKALVLYSLGNFTTAMPTLLCRVGLVQSLDLRRDRKTGQVDWFAPRGRLVYNVRRDRMTGKRRLVFLEDWLRTLSANEAAAEPTLHDLSHLRRRIVINR